MNIEGFVVWSNGKVNRAASVANFAAELDRFEEQRNMETSILYDAVHSVLDRFPGSKLPMAFIVSEVLKALNAQPENYRSLTNKVEKFIRSSPEFVMVRGKNGGICRLIDR